MLRTTGLLICAVCLAACAGDVDLGPARPRGGTSIGTPTGIVLHPPDGVGARASRCEPDHAPLVRLNDREYARTIADLFPGETFSSATIPANARQQAFLNNTAALGPTEQLVESLDTNGEFIGNQVAPTIAASLGCSDAPCFEGWVRTFGRRAYRRPLTDAEVTIYGDIYRSSPVAGDMEASIALAIATFLQSGSFFYRPEFGGGDGHLDSFEVASRLSYFIWGTMPDETLLAAAESGLTGTALAAEVDRMVLDDRARDGLLDATSQWFNLDLLADELKEAEFNFTPEVRAHLLASFQMFMWERVFRGGGLSELHSARGAYVDSTIGPFFGIADAGPTLEWRELDDRRGILTHPALLSMLGHGRRGAPILRGVFVLREVLCDDPTPPPSFVVQEPAPEMADDGTPLTTREGTAVLTERDGRCLDCHRRINPFGYAFENFDVVGRHRTEELDRPIDASGASAGFTLGATMSFDDAEELISQLDESDRVRACVVDRWVRYATAGGALAYDPCFRDELTAITDRPDATLTDLIIAIAVNPLYAGAEVVE